MKNLLHSQVWVLLIFFLYLYLSVPGTKQDSSAPWCCLLPAESLLPTTYTPWQIKLHYHSQRVPHHPLCQGFEPPGIRSAAEDAIYTRGAAAVVPSVPPKLLGWPAVSALWASPLWFFWTLMQFAMSSMPKPVTTPVQPTYTQLPILHGLASKSGL